MDTTWSYSATMTCHMQVHRMSRITKCLALEQKLRWMALWFDKGALSSRVSQSRDNNSMWRWSDKRLIQGLKHGQAVESNTRRTLKNKAPKSSRGIKLKLKIILPDATKQSYFPSAVPKICVGCGERPDFTVRLTWWTNWDNVWYIRANVCNSLLF